MWFYFKEGMEGMNFLGETEYFSTLNKIPEQCRELFIMTQPLTAYITQHKILWGRVKEYIGENFSDQFWDVIREYCETGKYNHVYGLFPDTPTDYVKGYLSLWDDVLKSLFSQETCTLSQETGSPPEREPTNLQLWDVCIGNSVFIKYDKYTIIISTNWDKDMEEISTWDGVYACRNVYYFITE